MANGPATASIGRATIIRNVVRAVPHTRYYPGKSGIVANPLTQTFTAVQHSLRIGR